MADIASLKSRREDLAKQADKLHLAIGTVADIGKLRPELLQSVSTEILALEATICRLDRDIERAECSTNSQ